MIRSMTGYGRAEHSTENVTVKIEIKSVNHRFSDIFVKMPRQLSYLEDTIRKTVSKNIVRGKIEVFLSIEYVSASLNSISIDFDLARNYKMELEKLCKQLDMTDQIRINNIIGLPELVKLEKKTHNEDEISEATNAALIKAVEAIIEMKILEGQELLKNFILCANKIEEKIKEIEERTDTVFLDYKERLRERLERLLEGKTIVDEERLAVELAFFADKCSINEEIIRLDSHIKQFRNIITNEDIVGRKLDFLVQEMNREVNTIGSKANDISISNNVILIKSEIEKIREQIQNLE